MSDYVFHKPVQPTVGPLPEGKYKFTVIDVSDDYTSTVGNIVLPVKIEVGPEKVWIYDNRVKGKTKKGKEFDNIAPFLMAIGRYPKEGEFANISAAYLVGATGEVMIKTEKAEAGKLAGKLVNKVAYYIWDQTSSDTSTAIVPGGQVDPDDIPF
jgi:hypothetical protein